MYSGNMTTMSIYDIFNSIREWGYDRNLVDGSSMQAQVVKLFEEGGELAGAVAKGNQQKLWDSIGDMVVVLTILAEQSGMSIENCIAVAYSEIKDRKGKMVDGIFIKDE